MTSLLVFWGRDQNLRTDLLKFIYSEKATKIFPLLLTTVHTVKSKGKISQNFVAFSEFMNFTNVSVVFSQQSTFVVLTSRCIFRKLKITFQTATYSICYLSKLFFVIYFEISLYGRLDLHPNQIQVVKLGNKERFDKEKIGIKEPFLLTNLPFSS